MNALSILLVQIAVVLRNLMANALDAASSGASPRGVHLRARTREGSLLARTGDYEQAEAVSAEAYFAAAEAGAWEVAAGAATDLVYAVGIKLARAVDGRGWARHAAVAIAHLALGEPCGCTTPVGSCAIDADWSRRMARFGHLPARAEGRAAKRAIPPATSRAAPIAVAASRRMVVRFM